MSTNTYYIEHDGKQLRTFNELKSWFETTVKKEKKKNPTYNENQLASTERATVVALINELIPTDNEGRLFKIALFQYLIQVLYRSIHTAMYPTKLPQDIFMEHLSWFDKQFEIIKDEKLQKQFLQNQIERTERISLDWTNHVDLTDPLFKHIFDAGQMFLSLLKTKITNYQHTPIASAHEKIIREHYYDECGLPISDNSILLAEYLEDRLIAEGVAYKRALDDNYMSLVFDKDYFKKFIPGALLSEFKQVIFDRTDPLNDREINKLLTLSLDQFKVINPANREKEFIEKFAHAHWFPNGMNKIYESEERPAKYIHKEFAVHFHLFVEAVQSALNDFRNNKLGSAPAFAAPHSPIKNNTPAFQPVVREYLNSHFFEDIKDGLFSKLELYNRVEKMTDNFNRDKLLILHEDFELFLNIEKDAREGDFTAEDINNGIKEYEAKKMEIPYKNIPNIIDKVNGKIVFGPDIKIIDVERLLYPFDFFPCYQFKNFLVTEINKRKTLSPPPDNISKPKDTFESLLTQPKQDFILKMLEDLSITTEGKPTVGGRSKSELLGVVQALLDKCILPKKSEFTWCKLIGNKISLVLTSKLDSSFKSKEMRKSASLYITNNYKL